MQNSMCFCQPFTISQKQINQFAEASGGFGPIHIDPEYAKKNNFTGTLVHGLLLEALIEKNLIEHWPEWMDKGTLEITFIKPVLVEQKVKLLFEKELDADDINVSILTEDNQPAVIGKAAIKQ